MVARDTGAGPTCRPLNGRTPEGASCVVVLAKRTYQFDASKSKIEPAEDQQPLRANPVFDGEPGDPLLSDTEAWPYKLLTDVVVHGHVYTYGVGQRTQAAVVVDSTRKDLTVVGDRRCTRSTNGRVLFSEPEPFERIPLSYSRAYGGYDHGAQAKHPNLFELIKHSLPPGTDSRMYSLCSYPRNQHGRGYYLATSTTPIDEVLLPNIEDPKDLLTPDRLVVEDPLAWWRQPLPAGTSWLHAGYFARCAYLGVRPFWAPLPDQLPEFTRGYLTEDVRSVDVADGGPSVFKAQNGASLGLQLSGVKGGSTVRLIGMHPERRELDIVVPNPPQMTVRTRWRDEEVVAPVLHHVELFPDDALFTMVWRGSAEAKRALLPEELDALPVSVEWKR